MYLHLLTVLVLSWARHVKLQTLPIEHLVVVETWRGLIETNVLARENFIIRGSALRSPLGSGVLEIILYFILSSTELLRALENVLSVVLVEGTLLSLHVRSFPNSRCSLRLANSN